MDDTQPGAGGAGGAGGQRTLEEAGMTGVPRRLFSCTPTRLSTWSDCPRRYRFTYVDRPPPPKGPPWAHTSYGASVHNALRAWYDLPRSRRTPAAAGSLVDGAWLPDGYRDAEQAAAARERATADVGAYLGGLDPDHEPRGLERTVAFRTDRLAVTGRIDRIDERPTAGGTELVVVDYKTSRRVSDVDEARGSLALALYVLGVRRTLRREDCRRVELHHVPSGAVAVWEHTEEGLARHLRRADAIAAEAQGADERYAATPDGPAREAAAVALYPATPSNACGWCDFVRVCPEGLAAARPREPWAAVPGVRGSGVGGEEKGDEGDATEAP